MNAKAKGSRKRASLQKPQLLAGWKALISLRGKEAIPARQKHPNLEERSKSPCLAFPVIAREELAKHLAAATIGYEMGISFDTAMRKYVGPHGRVGEMWKVAAQFILCCQAPDKSPTPGPELVGGNAA